LPFTNLPFASAGAVLLFARAGLLLDRAALLFAGAGLLFAGAGFLVLFSARVLLAAAFPDIAFGLGGDFVWRTFPSDLADLDWGIMGIDPVCC
jgi:hypothetical protein